MLRNSAINIVLKVGLSISLLLTALAGFVVPQNVSARWPSFIVNHSNEYLIGIFTSIVCLALVVWLFSSKKKFIAASSITVAIALAGLFNITDFSYLFELSPLFFISLALTLRYYPRIRVLTQTKVTPLTHVSHIDIDGEHFSEETEDGSSEHITGVVEADIHAEHDQHIFIPKN